MMQVNNFYTNNVYPKTLVSNLTSIPFQPKKGQKAILAPKTLAIIKQNKNSSNIYLSTPKIMHS